MYKRQFLNIQPVKGFFFSFSEEHFHVSTSLYQGNLTYGDYVGVYLGTLILQNFELLIIIINSLFLYHCGYSIQGNERGHNYASLVYYSPISVSRYSVT